MSDNISMLDNSFKNMTDIWQTATRQDIHNYMEFKQLLVGIDPKYGKVNLCNGSNDPQEQHRTYFLVVKYVYVCCKGKGMYKKKFRAENTLRMFDKQIVVPLQRRICYSTTEWTDKTLQTMTSRQRRYRIYILNTKKSKHKNSNIKIYVELETFLH